MNYKNIMVTGGSGFIGANFINHLFINHHFEGNVINVDKLTYAGNPENLEKVAETFGGTNYFFHQNDICDYEAIQALFTKYDIDCIVHFAAESHVDRSIFGPKEFIETNIVGTYNLLEICRQNWKDRTDVRFHHISTDEVYGSLGDTGYFYETTRYDPRSPYSASKASSDHLVQAYYHTYGLPMTISNCTNNYGPLQFPEKLVPLMVNNIKEQKPLPVYGDGSNIRDWLYVEDHCEAIIQILAKGKVGETYNIGGENEWTNLDLVYKMCELMQEFVPASIDYKSLITFVKDRPGHDWRYAINCDKIKSQLGWKQSLDFEEGLRKTVTWYLSNQGWVNNIKSGEYQKWLDKNYEQR